MTPMPRLLTEFLREQQEPFLLDDYLLERGYCRGSTSAVHLKCSIVLNKSWVCRKRQCAIRNCLELVKAALGKFAWCRNSQWACGEGTNGECRKVSDSCSESDGKDAQCMAKSQSFKTSCCLEEEQEKADAAGTASKWRSAGDKHKLSPISESHRDSPLHDSTRHESSHPDHDHYYMMNKRALRQTKRLLIDCVREVMLQGQVLRAEEEVWKLLCEHVWEWRKQSNCSELMELAQQWNAGFEERKEEIIVEIGEAILEAIINDILVL